MTPCPTEYTYLFPQLVNLPSSVVSEYKERCLYLPPLTDRERKS